jgi:hypothetical protein
MTLSWKELACHGLGKKIQEREVVALVMVHLVPMRIKWVKDHGKGEIEEYIMENGHHGKEELFENREISKEMWCKAALRREFKSQWWWRAPEKRRNRCHVEVLSANTRYSEWGPQPIIGMPDELLKNDVHGIYETLDAGRAVHRRWNDKWSREKDSEMIRLSGSWRGTRAILQAKWYQNIHEGRFFLFFKMNERLKYRIQKRVGCVGGQFCPEITSGYWDLNKKIIASDVMGFGPSEQCASDLLTIDGPGLNHPPGKEVIHIDEMFH